MKSFNIFLFCLAMTVLLPLHAVAQEVAKDDSPVMESLDNTPGVTVVQPDALAKRLAKAVPDETETSQPTVSGRTSQKGSVYRIEVYADNSRQAKNNASARRRNIESRFPQYPAVLVFDSPFWRVKVGNFSNRSDAEAAIAEIKEAFPSYAPYLRIVRN